MNNHPPVDYAVLPRHQMLCIDMKSFFASCECVIRGLDPMHTYLAVVGDLNRRGSVVLAASPALKRDFGIKTGHRLYHIPHHPEIHIVPARMGYYLQQSVHITRLLNQFVPAEAIHPYSIDESWVCADGTESLYGDAWSLAEQIRRAILDSTGLPACIGIGPNKFLAKVSLDIEGKKTGISACRYEDVPHKLWPLPVQELWGIGSRLAKKLLGMGIRTVGQLAQTPLEMLEKKFGIMGNQLYYHAWGVDLSPVLLTEQSYLPIKSVGQGITLLRDYRDREEVQTVLLELSEEVARRAREANMEGRCIHLSVGYSHKEANRGFSRSRTLPHPTHVTKEIYHTALSLFRQHDTGEVVRRLQLSLSQLTPCQNTQLSLFDDDIKQQKLGAVMDQIRRKYGPTALLRARSYTSGGTMLERAHKIGGHWAW